MSLAYSSCVCQGSSPPFSGGSRCQAPRGRLSVIGCLADTTLPASIRFASSSIFILSPSRSRVTYLHVPSVLAFFLFPLC